MSQSISSQSSSLVKDEGGVPPEIVARSDHPLEGTSPVSTRHADAFRSEGGAAVQSAAGLSPLGISNQALTLDSTDQDQDVSEHEDMDALKVIECRMARVRIPFRCLSS